MRFNLENYNRECCPRDKLHRTIFRGLFHNQFLDTQVWVDLFVSTKLIESIKYSEPNDTQLQKNNAHLDWKSQLARVQVQL